MTEQSLYSTAQLAVLVELLQQHTAQHPEQTASSFWVEDDVGEVRWTYQDLDERARMSGAHLQALNAAGERVLLLFPLCLDYSDFILPLVMQHIVTNFWSPAILAEELSVLYPAERRHRAVTLPSPRAQYSDFACSAPSVIRRSSMPCSISRPRYRVCKRWEKRCATRRWISACSYHRSPHLQTAYIAPRTELEWRIAQVR